MNLLTIAAILSALSVALLLVVAVTWANNYRRFRTPLALGLLIFCLVLLVENCLSLYFYVFTTEMRYVEDSIIGTFVVVMRVLQLLAVALFTYVSLR